MSVPTKCLLAGILLLIAVAACSRQRDASMASRGEIDAHAPVHAVAGIVIDASPDDVWKVLADVGGWPEWQHDILAATISQPAAAGVTFQWSISHGTIRSRLAVFEPPHRLTWFGTLFIFHAIHVWVLHAQPDGQTLVETRESMSGWPIAWFYSSADLLETDRQWLAALKIRMEAPDQGHARG